MWPVCAARIVVLTRVRSLVSAGGVHRGLAGERVHDILCPAGPGLAPSAYSRSNDTAANHEIARVAVAL